MAREINEKCLKCSLELVLTPEDRKRVAKHGYLPLEKIILDEKPSCWVLYQCSKKRNYYRNHERSKRRQNENHRYLKYKNDKCVLCGTKDDLEVHHVIPQKWNGEDVRHNLLTLCHACHTTITSYYKAVGWV